MSFTRMMNRKERRNMGMKPSPANALQVTSQGSSVFIGIIDAGYVELSPEQGRTLAADITSLVAGMPGPSEAGAPTTQP